MGLIEFTKIHEAYHRIHIPNASWDVPVYIKKLQIIFSGSFPAARLPKYSHICKPWIGSVNHEMQTQICLGLRSNHKWTLHCIFSKSQYWPQLPCKQRVPCWSSLSCWPARILISALWGAPPQFLYRYPLLRSALHSINTHESQRACLVWRVAWSFLRQIIHLPFWFIIIRQSFIHEKVWNAGALACLLPCPAFEWAFAMAWES